MRWLGHASPADRDEWRQVEELDHCRDLVAEYDAIEPTRRAARNGARRAAALPAPVPSPAAPLLAAPLTLPTGWGWVRCKVARISRAAGYSHVVAYGPQSALGSLEVVSLLDAASHGPNGRWVMLLRQSPSVSGFHFSGTAVLGHRPGGPGPARCDLVRRRGPTQPLRPSTVTDSEFKSLALAKTGHLPQSGTSRLRLSPGRKPTRRGRVERPGIGPGPVRARPGPCSSAASY